MAVATLMAVVAIGLTARPAARPVGAVQGAMSSVPQVGLAVGFAVSSPVSDLPEQASFAAPVARLASVPPFIPVPTLSFDGLKGTDDFFAPSAPNPNGDVGPNHYVQAAGTLVVVYDKTGAPLTAPFRVISLFASLGGLCSFHITGGRVNVLYDPLADRWLLSQIAFNPDPPYHQCIAISKTADPTGSYFLYDFVVPGSNFNDLPRFGVWADAYYMADDQFVKGTTFNGAGGFAFDRAKMLAGDATASFIYFNEGPGPGSMLPADVDGVTPPPVGAPGYFAMLAADEFGDPADAVRLFAFRADFANPGASTFSELPESPIPVAAFDPLGPNGSRQIEQPSPATSSHYLDAIQDRLMYRLAYRNFGGSRESLVVTHSINVGFDSSTTAGHQAAIRYYELRRSLPAGTFGVAEQATFAPDSDNRWLGSAAMDGQGNLAVGYSVSSLTTFPSIRYAGRLFSDPQDGLFQGEAVLAAGSGVQLTTGGGWGHYSALSVDPADDCTFWYTNEYFTAASQLNTSLGWLTRIGTFKFPNCGPQSPRGTVTGRVTDAVTGAPIAGVMLSFSPGTSAVVTDANGTYGATIPTGTYSVTAFLRNHPYQSVFGVGVTSGSTTTVDFAITLPPAAGILTGRVRNATSNAPIAYAVVSAGGVLSTTDASGLYALSLPVGTYSLTVAAAYYVGATVSGVVVSNQGVTTRDVALSVPANMGFLTGHVRNGATNGPVANAIVSVGAASTTTNAAGFYSFNLPAATYTVTASATDYLYLSAAGVVVSDQGVTTRDLALQSVSFTPAAYGPTLKAPECAAPGAGCDSGTLLTGRASIPGGPEPNQPNTILNTCADGALGTFHVQPSLDRIKLYALDGGVFTPGKTVRIQTTVWASSSLDRLDLYYATDASNPAWTFLTTLTPPGLGVQLLSATYVLPAGPLQAVRGNFRNSGSAGSCTTGSLDDRDDLIFATSTVTGQVVDALTGVPIAGTSVNISSGGPTVLADARGIYGASVPAGTYTLIASSPTHLPQSASGVIVSSGSTTTVNFSLSLASTTGVLSGHVRDASTGAPLANVVVSVNGANTSSTTDGSGAYALFLPSGTYGVTAVATDYVRASFSGIVVSSQAATTFDIALDSVFATYDGALKAPRCGQDFGVCDSGGLLVGRGSVSGGPEPNQPNTILNSCQDNDGGVFHLDESLDRFRILTLDGGPFAPGKTVRIEATVWVANSTFDRLELYGAANALSPNWTLIASLAPTVFSGVNTLSATYVLPAGNLQAIRARFHNTAYLAGETACPTFKVPYDDVDDLIFGTDTTSTAPVFLIQPDSQTVTTGKIATFVVAVSGSLAPSYQWQVSTNGGASWANLTDTATYNGVTTPRLTVNAMLSLDGYQFRVVATNALGSTTSNAAQLSVINLLEVTTIAGLAGGIGNADGAGSAARFFLPYGLAVDAAGTVYVADTNNHTIRKITSAGVVSTLAGSPGIAGSADGTGSTARFRQPTGVTVDSAGTVYVADTGNYTIRTITPAGVVGTLAGLAGAGGSADGPGSTARFGSPGGVAVDGANTVYVADTGNQTIRKISAAGVVTTLAGSAGSIGAADGTGSAARFRLPRGVAVDSAGVVYVADTSNLTIRRITSSGLVSTIAGLPTLSGNVDGLGSAARFAYPSGVTVDVAGTLYVADGNNDAIRRITPGGSVVTVAGAGTVGSTDGIGPAARFHTPYGVAIDGAGTVYVADTYNSTIRRATQSVSGSSVLSTSNFALTPGLVKLETPAAHLAGIGVVAAQADAGKAPSGTDDGRSPMSVPSSAETATTPSSMGDATRPFAAAGVLTASIAAAARNLVTEAVAAPPPSDEPVEVVDTQSTSVTVHDIQQLIARPATVRPEPLAGRAQVFSTVAVADRRWEIEFFGGGLLADRPAGGTFALPSGEAFMTAQGNPSRRVSSWYLGDGALLLNQVNAAMGISQQITPLDGFVNSTVAHRQNGRSLGVRVSRVISPRLTVEVTVEFGPGTTLSRGNLDRLESTRATFLSAWNGLFSTGSFQSASLSSTVTPTVTEAGRQVFTTGAVNVALRTRGLLMPYVTVGTGLASSFGGTPTTTVVGAYRFVFNGTTPINETDSVTIRHAAGNSLVGILGGGLKYYLSPRWGVRLDARWYLSPNAIDNLVDASPAVASGSPAGSVASATNPAIQFSNSPSTGIQSSLSGPAVTDYRIFEGGGIQSHLSLTAGIIRRF